MHTAQFQMAKPGSKEIAALKRERRRLLREMSSLSLLVRGTVLTRFSTCSREHCRCHGGEKHGPRTYVVVTRDKKQRQIYVRNNNVQTLQAGVAQHRRLLEIVDRMTAINLELMRVNAGHDGREVVKKPLSPVR